jgi:general stress protein 26
MTLSKDDLRSRFWRDIEAARTGMLGVSEGDEARFQPMTPHFEDQSGAFWFFARAASPLAEAAERGSAATFTYTATGRDLFACVRGWLAAETDEATRQKFWTEDVARWFPGGPQSDEVAMLRFEADSAQIWLPEDSLDAASMSFGASPGAPQDVHGSMSL